MGVGVRVGVRVRVGVEHLPSIPSYPPHPSHRPPPLGIYITRRHLTRDGSEAQLQPIQQKPHAIDGIRLDLDLSSFADDDDVFTMHSPTVTALADVHFVFRQVAIGPRGARGANFEYIRGPSP